MIAIAHANRLFSEAAHDAVVALFAAYGLSLTPSGVETVQSNPELSLISVIGFSGDGIRGSVVLAMSDELIYRALPSCTSRPDGISELANQHLGRMKNWMLRTGIELHTGSPALINGRHLLPAVHCPDFHPFVFASGDGVVCLWVDVDIAHDLRRDAGLMGAYIPSEGDLLLF